MPIDYLLPIVGRVIAIKRAIEKRSYTTYTKIETKRLRAITMWGAIEKMRFLVFCSL